MAEATLPNGYSYFNGDPTDLLMEDDTLSLLVICSYCYTSDDMLDLLDTLVTNGCRLMLVTDKLDFYPKNTVELFPFEMVSIGEFSEMRLSGGLRGDVPPHYIIMGEDTFKVNAALASSFLNDIPSEAVVNSSITINVVEHGVEYQNLPMAMSYKHGKGEIYIVANPLLFTNYGVLDTTISRFLGKQMEQIADHRVLRLSERAWRGYTIGGYDDYDANNTMAPLSYFLSQKPLRWAIYTLLVGLVIFMFFTARRRQRVIPVVEQHKNRNLEFVQLLGTIYCRNHDNLDLLRKKFTYFKEDLRRKLLIDLDDASNQTNHVRMLSQKTGLEEQEVAATLDELRRLTSGDEFIENVQLMRSVRKIDKIIKKLN
jgi:hypothetical protein